MEDDETTLPDIEPDSEGRVTGTLGWGFFLGTGEDERLLAVGGECVCVCVCVVGGGMDTQLHQYIQSGAYDPPYVAVSGTKGSQFCTAVI